MELGAVLSAEAISPDMPAHPYFNALYQRADDILTRAFTTMAHRGELRANASPKAAGQLALSTPPPGLQSNIAPGATRLAAGCGARRHHSVAGRRCMFST